MADEKSDGFKYDGRCQVVGCNKQAQHELEGRRTPKGTIVQVCADHAQPGAVASSLNPPADLPEGS